MVVGEEFGEGEDGGFLSKQGRGEFVMCSVRRPQQASQGDDESCNDLGSPDESAR